MLKRQRSVEITAVWARREGPDLIVSVEIEGEWHVAIRELADSNYGHIAEANGYYADGWHIDSVVSVSAPED